MKRKTSANSKATKVEENDIVPGEIAKEEKEPKAVKTIRIECLEVHHDSEAGSFEAGELYQIDETKAEQLVDQFPKRFKKRSGNSEMSSVFKKRIEASPENKSMSGRTTEKK